MEEFHQTSWYVSRTIDAPVEVAAAAFDRLVTEPDATGEATLALSAAAVSISYTPYPGAPRRCVRGQLVPGRARRRIAVELELAPWSSLQSQVGLRPARRPPRGARAETYFEAAVRALDDLTRRLESTSQVRTMAVERFERAS